MKNNNASLVDQIHSQLLEESPFSCSLPTYRCISIIEPIAAYSNVNQDFIPPPEFRKTQAQHVVYRFEDFSLIGDNSTNTYWAIAKNIDKDDITPQAIIGIKFPLKKPSNLEQLAQDFEQRKYMRVATDFLTKNTSNRYNLHQALIRITPQGNISSGDLHQQKGLSLEIENEYESIKRYLFSQ